MPQNSPRRELAYHQLCAIARLLLTTTPDIVDADWREAIKVTVLRQGYDYPSPEWISSAMASVERAMVQILGPRPIPTPPLPQRGTMPQQHDPPWQGAKRSGTWATLADLVSSLRGSTSSGRTSNEPTEAARDVLALDESVVLRAFWKDAHALPGRRLSILWAYSEIAIQRPTQWSPEEIRREHDAAWSRPTDACFACLRRDRRMDWHHVIQIQHGGSNSVLNRVPLCECCHSDLHPWLEPNDRNRSPWSHLSKGGGPAPSASRAPMRQWRLWTSTIPGQCGYDDSHVIRTGDWFLELDRFKRCRACALTRHGETEPPTEPVDHHAEDAPVVRMPPPPTAPLDSKQRQSGERE